MSAVRLAAEHLDDLVDLHLDPEVSRFLGGVRTPEATAAYLETNLDHWSEHGLGLWVLRAQDGAFVGRAGLRFVEVDGASELEIAYTLARSAWGHGFATEVARALVEIWRVQRSEPSLVGLVVKGNAPSERVLQKVGFRYEGDAAFHGEDCGLFRLAR